MSVFIPVAVCMSVSLCQPPLTMGVPTQPQPTIEKCLKTVSEMSPPEGMSFGCWEIKGITVPGDKP